MASLQLRSVLAGIAVSAIAACAGVLLLLHDQQPAGRAGALQGSIGMPSAEAARPARELTWAMGQRLHLGDRAVATGRDLLSIDVVDGGAAFTTFDGSVWFTDGSRVEVVGTTTPGNLVDRGIAWGASGRPNRWVVSENSGSRFAWFEYPTGDRPEIVVYDASLHRRVARVAVDVSRPCARCARIVAVDAKAVYWTTGLWHGLGSAEDTDPRRNQVFRIDVETGARSTVSPSRLRAAFRAGSRMLVVGDSPDSGTLTDGIGQEFAVVDGQLVARARGGAALFDSRGTRLRLRAPPGFHDSPTGGLLLFQWLDDDTVALLDATGWTAGVLGGEDLLVCKLTTGRCRVAVRTDGAQGSPIVPELGTPGSELALTRAIRDR